MGANDYDVMMIAVKSPSVRRKRVA